MCRWPPQSAICEQFFPAGLAGRSGAEPGKSAGGSERSQSDEDRPERRAHLTARERHIIRARFPAEQPTALEDLGATFSVSRGRIRQIEVRALQKIRSAMRPHLEGALSPASARWHPPLTEGHSVDQA
jgi:hypothetical protein